MSVNPESTLRHDPYINDKFLDIFRHEDANGALGRAVEESLSANDGGGSRSSTANGLAAWFRAGRGAGA